MNNRRSHGVDTMERTGKKDRKQPVKVTSDPSVTVYVASEFVAMSIVISNSENPVWMQQFYVPAAHLSAEIQFLVKDSDVVGSRTIGAVGVQVEKLAHALLVEGTFPILSKSGKPCNPGAVLTLSIQYGVPCTYFPLRKGGKVTLYQDSHVDDGCLQSMHLEGGLQYQNNGNCWHDICEAIKQACHLIYITGWSVVHSVQLVRSGDGAKDSTLGDLLKAKSAEGVRVLLLWDEPTSKSNLGIKTHGVMGTNDEETRHFFKHSSVKVIFCPRSAGNGHRLAKKQETDGLWHLLEVLMTITNLITQDVPLVYLENYGMIYTVESKVQQHMMYLKTLRRDGCGL